jgi:outer membrane immunogenic protein
MSSVSALAADLPVRYTKAPAPVAVAAYDWSGFYLGANGGWGSSNKHWYLGVADDGAHNATGAVAGGQIGYNWQVGSWVFGLEAQGDWADLKGSNASLRAPTIFNNTKVDAFGLFTGRVGYAWNNALLYVKGGAAVVSDKYDWTGTTLTSASETRWGAAVGTGLEFGFAPNWSVAVEYDHAFLDTHDVTFGNGTVQGIKQDLDIVTARVNYRFGGAAVPRF